MRAGAKAPLVLAAIAVVLGGYIVVFERNHDTTDEARAARQRLFPGLVRGDITAIEIDRGAKGRVVLTRAPAPGGDGPWLVEPDAPARERASADSGAVADLLDAVDALEIDRVATASPSAAGLEAPVARLAITSPAGRFALDAGDVDASGRGVFVRRAGDSRTLVVARRLRDLIDRGAGAFRARRLFGATSPESITVVAFETSGGPRQTLRKRAGLWLDEQGELAARAAVGEALRGLTALEASDFPAAGQARPPAPPRQTLEQTATAVARLEIWDAGCGGDAGAPQHLAALSGAAGAASEWICLDAAGVDHLWRQLEAANRRDPHLLIVEPAEADGVILSEGEKRRLHLRRAGAAGWRFVEPTVSYDADAQVIDAWLARLAKTTFAAAAAPAAASAGERAATRRLVVEGATRVELELSPPRAGQARAVRAGETAPGVVDAPAFTDLEPEPLRFRSRAVLSLARFDVTSLDIRAAGKQITLGQAPGGRWSRTIGHSPPAAAPDPPAVERLVGLLADLHAEAFLPRQPFTPETTVDIEVRTGDTTRRERLELASTCLARLTDAPVFSLGDEACHDLRQALSLATRSERP